MFAAVLAAAVMLAGASSAEASRRCDGLARSSAAVTLIAHDVRTFGGTRCRSGRAVVARLFRAMLARDEECAGQTLTPDACEVGRWLCRRTRFQPFRGRCVDVDGGRAVRWRERDVPSGT